MIIRSTSELIYTLVQRGTLDSLKTLGEHHHLKEAAEDSWRDGEVEPRPAAALPSPLTRSTPCVGARMFAHPTVCHARRSIEGRLLQETDAGDAIAVVVALAIILTAVCAFLGWYSRRRG